MSMKKQESKEKKKKKEINENPHFIKTAENCAIN